MNLRTEVWFDVVGQEEAELLAMSVVEDILQTTHTVLFARHIENQLLPFAVECAKANMVETIRWLFYKRDGGRLASEVWMPDEEPQPCPIDVCARGVLPITNMSSYRASMDMINAVMSEVNLYEKTSSATPSQKNLSQKMNEKATAVQFVAEAEENAPTSESVSSLHSLESRRYSRITEGRLSTTLNPLKPKPPPSLKKVFTGSTSTEATVIEDNSKIMSRIISNEKSLWEGGRPRYTYDSEGRIMAIRKSHDKHNAFGIRTKVSDTIETDNLSPSKKTKGSKIPFRRNVAAEKGTKALNAEQLGLTQSQNLEDEKPHGNFIHDSSLDIPSLVDTIKLAPGVTLKEGEMVFKGPQYIRKTIKKPGSTNDLAELNPLPPTSQDSRAM